jgi:hypothetical protein
MRPLRRLVAALLLLAAPAAAEAQPAVVSPAPEAVNVTVYRGRYAGSDGLDLQSLQGFALITETRTVRLPAGDSVVRFEGVSDGIIPATAIAVGLPGAPGEKNRDARLISAGSLIEATLGRRVHIRRTDRKTGRVTESEAVIRSGPDGIILQTQGGFEALRCTGTAETLVYDGMPSGLTARPTLAVTTHSAEATVATVRLSYLATGFDWQANYVAEVAPDGRTLDLFAWLTLANGNDTSFTGARTMAVAGKANSNESEDDAPLLPRIELKCWPNGRTHEIPETKPVQRDIVNSLPASSSDSIVVTGSRVMRANYVSASPVTVIATQENLGDLKLYRIPIPVTFAANSQKQVALLTRSKVPFERGYGAEVDTIGRDPDSGPQPVRRVLRMKNRPEKGLGLPLPQGWLTLTEPAGAQPLLAGQATLGDTAVGEDLELWVGVSHNILIAHRIVEKEDEEGRSYEDRRYDPKPERHEVELTNAGSAAVVVDVLLPTVVPWEVAKPSQKLGVKNGHRLWRARVPANGRARLLFTLRPVPKLLPKRPPPEGEEEK